MLGRINHTEQIPVQEGRCVGQPTCLGVEFSIHTVLKFSFRRRVENIRKHKQRKTQREQTAFKPPNSNIKSVKLD